MELLRASESGIVAQGVRFALAGGLVAVVYLTTTSLLANVAGVAFQIALPLGFGLAISVHFTLQRFFVWAHREDFALPLHRQARRYLAAALLQYGLTAASTAVLPRPLGVSTEVVYLATAAALLVVNFVVYRHGIFHPRSAEDRPRTSGGQAQARGPGRGR